MMVVFKSVAQAATALPRAKSNNPKMMTGLRPKRSDAMPKGNCNTPCVRL